MHGALPNVRYDIAILKSARVTATPASTRPSGSLSRTTSRRRRRWSGGPLLRRFERHAALGHGFQLADRLPAEQHRDEGAAQQHDGDRAEERERLANMRLHQEWRQH